MAEKTNISWCDSTFNPWIGCTNVSPGCDHCYAERQDKFRGWTPAGWGAGNPRRRTSDKLWDELVKWNGQPFYECASCGWRGTSKEWERGGCCTADNLTFARRRVFCASLADVFDNEVPIEWLVDLLNLYRRTPNLDKLTLTKRIGNVLKRLDAAWSACTNRAEHIELRDYIAAWLNGTPPADVWLGATIVNQEEADRDIPKLLATPARVRFLSMEPLLGPVDLEYPVGLFPTGPRGCCSGHECGCMGRPIDPPLIYGVNWVILGAESGPGARSVELNWVRSIARQCRAANVPVLVKQLGRAVLDDGMSSPGEHWPVDKVRKPIPRRTEADPGFVVHLRDRKGGDWKEWPEDLRVREFPEVAS